MGYKLTGYSDWDQNQVYIYSKGFEGTGFCGEDTDDILKNKKNTKKYCSLQQIMEKGEK